MTAFLRNLNNTDIRNIIAVMIIFGAITFLFALLLVPIPKENKDLVNISIGFVIGSGVASVVGYYFGSTKDKNHEIK